jgi:signal transduction histidine kinase
VPALERLADTYREQTGVAVDLEAQLPPERLPSEVETTLYRIAQEGLTNVTKHARARRVSILLTRKGAAVVAVLEDDGDGFDPATVSEQRLGLAGMRERVALLGGKLTVESAAGSGTTLVAEVPLR